MNNNIYSYIKMFKKFFGCFYKEISYEEIKTKRLKLLPYYWQLKRKYQK